MDPLIRNNVRVTGNSDGPTIVLVHGFGGSGESWRSVTPYLEPGYRVVVLDHTGSGESDLSAYDPVKYDSLFGYADDLIEIAEALDLRDATVVGHSVAGIIALLASNQRPDIFSRLALVGPSPRYLDADGYLGGFTREAIDDLLTSLDANYLSFSDALAPVLMGNPDRPELSHDLAASIRAIDPAVAAQFARVTFLSDNRRDLADVSVPTLILQSTEDNVASIPVGEYVHAQIPHSEFVLMDSRGHVPHLSAPAEVAKHIQAFLR